MSLAIYPAIKLGENQEKIRRSISRLTTGLNILAGGTSGDFAEGLSLKAEGKSNQKVISTTKVGLDLLKTAESALIELASLATRRFLFFLTFLSSLFESHLNQLEEVYSIP